MKLVRREDYLHQKLKSQQTGELYSDSFVLSEALESKDFFLRHEIVHPGHKTSAPHFHEHTEEVIYVVKGSPTAVEGEQRCLLHPGSALCFAAGSKRFHFLVNETKDVVELLVLTRLLKKPDVVFE